MKKISFIIITAIIMACGVSAASEIPLLSHFAVLRPLISEPPFLPLNNLSQHNYQLTITGLYGYERYDLPVWTSFPLHRAGFGFAASGAFTETLGWNIAAGMSFAAMAAKRVSMTPGSCAVPVSASLAWRFLGSPEPDRTNVIMFGGISYSYGAVRGYYRADVPGPTYLFYLIKMKAQADIAGSVYGIFAGIKPSVALGSGFSLQPFAAYRITFDTSRVDYHVRLKVLNDELGQSGPVACSYRIYRDGEKPIHEILAGIELNVFGAGMQFTVQYSPVINRIFLQTGISYTYSFYAAM